MRFSLASPPALFGLLFLLGCPDNSGRALVDEGDNPSTESDGYALSFDGDSGCAQGTLALPLLLTAEAWVRSDSSGADHPLLFWGEGLVIGQNANGFIYANDATDAARGISTVSSWSDGDWHHLAVTWDSFTMELFLDGKRLAFAPVEQPGGVGSTLAVGCRPGSGGVFQGLIDEVRLSEAILYTADFTPPSARFEDDADTRALWHFDEGGGETVATDEVADIPLTLSGTTWVPGGVGVDALGEAASDSGE